MPKGLKRVEFSLLAEDADLLERAALSMHTSVSELVRHTLYQNVPALKRAMDERNERIYQEVKERQKMREWTGQQSNNGR